MEHQQTGIFRRVVLTGGPCGGKTTVQVTLSDVFENMGWKVYRVTETATLLLGGGVVFSKLDSEQSKQFQLNLLKVMLSLEDTYMDLARRDAAKGLKAIVICDRGSMDPSAYMPREEWLDVLGTLGGLDEIALRDERYDCVLHLVTAALGAESHFGAENNHVRSESIDLARHLDNLVAKAWIGHPYYDIIDNSTGFEEKKDRVVAAVLRRLGLKDNRAGKDIVKRKFLIKDFDFTSLFPTAFRDFEVEHDYLMSTEHTQTRIRKRGYDGSYVYSLTHRTIEADGSQIEIRRTIPGREYAFLLSQRDPTRQSIIKKRRCFLWENQYYQLDSYMSPNPGLVLLEAYVHSANAADHTTSPLIIIPPFLTVDRDVTKDSHYSMFNLSKIHS